MSMYCCLTIIRASAPFFFFNDTAPTEIYTLSLHDALPISRRAHAHRGAGEGRRAARRHLNSTQSGYSILIPPLCARLVRSEEHTSELQSRRDLVCRLLLEKKKKKNKT